MFIANTGMNLAQVRNLKWDDNYELGVESQGFREIKYRAGNRKVSFIIKISFHKKFQIFLKLRGYLLNGRECEHLFFTLGANLDQAPKAIGPDVTSNFYNVIKKIDPQVEKVLSRGWRAAKADWLVRNTDVSTAALVLQNSESTVMKHYMGGSVNQSLSELGLFFERLSDVVKNSYPLKSKEALIDSPLGECNDFGNPTQVEFNQSIQPNCAQPEGCLFCDKYIVHMDERDVRKLISYLLCINQTSSLSSSNDHFHTLFDPIILRIQLILDFIYHKSAKHQQLVKRVRKEVEIDGIFDPYWEGKLEMLIEIGALKS